MYKKLGMICQNLSSYTSVATLNIAMICKVQHCHLVWIVCTPHQITKIDYLVIFTTPSDYPLTTKLCRSYYPQSS